MPALFPFTLKRSMTSSLVAAVQFPVGSAAIKWKDCFIRREHGRRLLLASGKFGWDMVSSLRLADRSQIIHRALPCVHSSYVEPP